MLEMHLAPPTSPAYAAVSSGIMKMRFSATCQQPVKKRFL
jgi:hypothetical protein